MVYLMSALTRAKDLCRTSPVKKQLDRFEGMTPRAENDVCLRGRDPGTLNHVWAKAVLQHYIPMLRDTHQSCCRELPEVT